MSGMFEPPVRYAPALLEKVRQRAAPAVASVQVVFSGADAELLRREALARNVTPLTLAKALLAEILKNHMVDAVLDGDRPEHCASGHRRRLDGLTFFQAAVLNVVAANRDGEGVCRLSRERIAHAAGTDHAGTAGHALGVLVRQGLLQRDGAEKDPRRAAWRLTAEGNAVADDLTGGEGA